MTDVTSLISFFLILLHYRATFVVYQQNRINNTTSNSLTNIFSVNHIQDGFFWRLLTDWGAKVPTSLKSVTHTL